MNGILALMLPKTLTIIARSAVAKRKRQANTNIEAQQSAVVVQSRMNDASGMMSVKMMPTA